MAMNDLKVLCVDDRADASSSLQQHLSPHFDCTVVSNADEALQSLADKGPFAVVITDHIATDTNGGILLHTIKQRWPDTIGVMVTAIDRLDAAIAALHNGNVYRFVRTPWKPEEIVHAVQEAAEYFRLIQNERMLREQLARTNAELDEKVQDLDEANELLEYWVEFSPAVLYSTSCDHGVLHPSYISKNFYRLTGFERTAAVIDPSFWSDLIHPDDRAHYHEVLSELISADDMHAVLEYRVRHRDGNYLTVVDSIRAVRDGEGETIELVGAWMNVSARY